MGISNAHMVEVVTENQTKLAEDIMRQSESDVILSCVDPYYGPSPAGYYDALSEAAKSGKKGCTVLRSILRVLEPRV